jgi:hypothetical protein
LLNAFAGPSHIPEKTAKSRHEPLPFVSVSWQLDALIVAVLVGKCAVNLRIQFFEELECSDATEKETGADWRSRVQISALRPFCSAASLPACTASISRRQATSSSNTRRSVSSAALPD